MTNYRVLMLKDYRVCPMNVNLNVATPSIEFKSSLSVKDSDYNSEQVDIFEVFHCDGLLLCTTKGRLVVWNPCLGETRWINFKTDDVIFSKFALGHQNNKSCRSYKILGSWRSYFTPNQHVGSVFYEFTSDLWSYLLDSVALNCLIKSDIGVSLKGNTYWLASDEETNFLLNFDFTTERSKRLYLPPIRNFGMYKMILSIVREEQPAALHQNLHTLKMEIWMTNNVDIDGEAVLMCCKSYSVDIPIRSFYCLSFMSYLLDEEKKVNLTSLMTSSLTISQRYW